MSQINLAVSTNATASINLTRLKDIEENQRFKWIKDSTAFPLELVHLCWSYFLSSTTFASCRAFVEYFQHGDTLHLMANEPLIIRGISLITRNDREQPFPLAYAPGDSPEEIKLANFNNLLRRLFAPLGKRLAFGIQHGAMIKRPDPRSEDCHFVCSHEMDFTVTTASVISTRLSDLFLLMRHYSLNQVTFAPHQTIEFWGFSAKEYQEGIDGNTFAKRRLPGMDYSLTSRSDEKGAKAVIGGDPASPSYGLFFKKAQTPVSTPVTISIWDIVEAEPQPTSIWIMRVSPSGAMTRQVLWSSNAAPIEQRPSSASEAKEPKGRGSGGTAAVAKRPASSQQKPANSKK